MFAEHQPPIAAYATESVQNFSRVVRFVLATIQRPFSRAGEILEDFERHGADSREAFSSKKTALAWLAENEEDFFRDVIAASKGTDAGLLWAIMRCPGLGVIKAGFVSQLVFGRVGCLDTHNQRRLGYTEKSFAADKVRSAKDPEKVLNAYVDACSKAGGCDRLWDDWCNLVAKTYPETYESGYHVSRLHLDFVCAK